MSSASNGPVYAKVADNKDPDKLGRVKVSFPQLGEDCLSDWAPVARPFATEDAGFCIMPDVGDRVLCAFVQDNVRLPVVLGIVYHARQKPPLDPAPGNEKKIFSTPSGAQILLEDFMGLEKLTISSGDGNMVAELDVLGGVTISNGDGAIEIETKELIIGGASDGSLGCEKTLEIKAGGKITIDAEKNLLLKTAIDLEQTTG